MHRFGKVAIAAALPLAVGAKALTAQVAGIPVYYNPRGGMGVSAAANVGFLSHGGGGGGAKAVALSGGLGAGPAYFTATVGRFNPDETGVETETSFGATGSVKVFGGVAVPSVVPVDGPTPLMDVLMLAGAPVVDANMKKIWWVHGGVGSDQAQLVNLKLFLDIL